MSSATGPSFRHSNRPVGRQRGGHRGGSLAPRLRHALAGLALAASGAAQAACIPWASFTFEPNKVTEVEVMASPLTKLAVRDETTWRGALRAGPQVIEWLQASVAAGCQQLITLSAEGEIGRYVRDHDATPTGGFYSATTRIDLKRGSDITTLDKWRFANKVTSGPSGTPLDHDHDHTLDPGVAAGMQHGDMLYVATRVKLGAGLKNVTEGGDRVVVSYEWAGQPVLLIYMPEPLVGSAAPAPAF